MQGPVVGGRTPDMIDCFLIYEYVHTHTYTYTYTYTHRYTYTYAFTFTFTYTYTYRLLSDVRIYICIGLSIHMSHIPKEMFLRQ